MRQVAVVLGALGLLAALVVASASCLVDRKTGEFACASTAECADGRVCTGGFCIQDTAPPDADPGCPAPCDECDLTLQTCTVDCGVTDNCDAVTCPAGFACDITCGGSNACDDIDCTEAASCLVTCDGVNACGNVTCGAGTCDVTCSGVQACDVVDCRDACECDVDCDAGDDCQAARCPVPTSGQGDCTDGTPAGCDSTPAKCERTCP